MTKLQASYTFASRSKGFIQNALISITTSHLIARLFTGLIHQFLMAYHGVAQFLQPVAKLIAIPRLILDLIAKPVTKQAALFIRACCKGLLLVAKLLLILVTSLSHIFYRLHYFYRQGLILI
jgi:hypothetical protein